MGLLDVQMSEIDIDGVNNDVLLVGKESCLQTHISPVKPSEFPQQIYQNSTRDTKVDGKEPKSRPCRETMIISGNIWPRRDKDSAPL